VVVDVVRPGGGLCSVLRAVPWQAVQPDYTKSVAAYLGHYAAHDDWATPEEAARLETELTGVGREARFHVYPGPSHAFYDAAAAELAWERTIGFLRRHLG
jgi:carboxymethylenebutenolidase